MSLSSSPELFINMKSIPDVDSEEYEPFFQRELEKITYGVTINGVKIDPWLYWHINHWNIFKDVDDKVDHSTKRKFGHPDLRDNEWDFAEKRAEAREARKGMVMIGIRRFAKSEIEASIIGRSATIFNGSENVVSGGNNKDIKLITDKLDRGLNGLHPYFKYQRVEDDWNKQVTLGIKESSGRRMAFSYILIRNYDDGNNTEAAAGITATEFIIDEIGKFLFLRCLEAAIPSFTSANGWRCSPLLVGTGGSFEKGSDAEKVVLDPEAYNMMSWTWKDEPKKFGFIVPHTYRMEAKVETNLGEWLTTEKGILIPKDSELNEVPFLKSDPILAEKITNENRERAKKANDQQAYLKEVMYYPKNPQECFLTMGNNFYNADAARAQKGRILQMGRTGTPVILHSDGETIHHVFSDKNPIQNFPTKPMDDKDAPAVIWEFPVDERPPYGLYVAGIDPYKQDMAKYSDSIGVVYIFKRMHELQSDKYQDMFVACYAARPKEIGTWNTQAELLIRYYNARALCENEDMGFINHMIYRGFGHLMEDQPGWLREIVPNTTVNRPKGIHRSAQSIRTYLHGCLKQYADDKIGVRRDAEDKVIGDVLGITRVLDPMLCEEIAKFTDDGNYDREVAASLAIAMARHLDPQFKTGSASQDPRLKAYFAGRNRSTSFLDRPGVSIFGQKKRSLF